MQLSARNQLRGKVVSVNKGIVTAEVKLDIGGGQTITGVISKTSADQMQIAAGDELTAVIKATSVMFLK